MVASAATLAPTFAALVSAVEFTFNAVFVDDLPAAANFGLSVGVAALSALSRRLLRLAVALAVVPATAAALGAPAAGADSGLSVACLRTATLVGDSAPSSALVVAAAT